MCLLISPTDYHHSVSYCKCEKDIECFKVVYVQSYCGKIVALTPFRFHRINFGITCIDEAPDLTICDRVSSGFFHSYVHLNDALHAMEKIRLEKQLYNAMLATVKCIIPANTIFYRGTNELDYTSGYASKAVRLTNKGVFRSSNLTPLLVYRNKILSFLEIIDDNSDECSLTATIRMFQ